MILRYGETNVVNEELFDAKKETIKIQDVDDNNTAISKLVETKKNSYYLIGCLDKVIGPLILILPKISGYVKTLKVKDGDKFKSNKLMSFHTDDDKLFQNYLYQIEDLKILN